ncbi:hypothetical protein [Phenylobacterium sp. Root700]|uniref:hypothetical protein n=1 Tax=Phenylobacterium sp. Root700 TaxID=1736591 RepID=UPI0012E33496|nr:hypothetical protein [Phenylobacterium sp. Root700]
MKLLALPGRKPSTFKQMQDLTDRLRLGQDVVTLRPYGFWSHEDIANPDVRPEAEAVAAIGADLVIAKSIGTLVAMIARRDYGLAPRAAVFIATPLKRFEAQGLVPLLSAHLAEVPTLLIQQTADYNGSHDDLAAVVMGHEQATIREIPGDDHLYEETELIAPLIERWWSERL